METIDKLGRLMPSLAASLAEAGEALTEVRLYAGRPSRILTRIGRSIQAPPVTREALSRLLAALMDFSVHTHEDELARGFITLEDGSRVGVCGAAAAETGRLLGAECAGSVCLRIAREARGCAKEILPYIIVDGVPRSSLIVSPPGMGKTTCLRDIARQLSEGGLSVCVADERHEIAACRRGVPTLDVGPCTDVMDGGPKADTIPAMLRAMAPRVIVADEIGGPGDGAALADARRCGATIIASAHGAGFDEIRQRVALREALAVFDCLILLGDVPGRVKAVADVDGGELRPCICA